MNRWQDLEAFFTNPNVEISVGAFVVNLVLAAVLGWLLSRFYVRYSRALSNRRAFAGNFVLLTTTTMLIISVVKSSLALSLGLVGALSIVRFRAAIKEPEELAYLFLAIAIGLGLGADQRLITLVAFAGILAIVAVKEALSKPEDHPNLYLTVTSHNPRKLALDEIVRILEAGATEVDLKRFDEDGEALEASFVVDFESFEALNRVKAELQEAGDDVKVSFLDHRGGL